MNNGLQLNKNEVEIKGEKRVPFGKSKGRLRAGGEMAEWLKAAVLKTVRGASSSGVRIPLSPPINLFYE